MNVSKYEKNVVNISKHKNDSNSCFIRHMRQIEAIQLVLWGKKVRKSQEPDFVQGLLSVSLFELKLFA